MVIEIGNPWSAQEVDIWLAYEHGGWRVERRNIPMWNYMGSRGTYPRIREHFFLFPKGFDPNEVPDG